MAHKGSQGFIPKLESAKPLDTCLRLVTDYDIGTDSFVTRIDVLLDCELLGYEMRNPKPGPQFNSIFFSGIGHLEEPEGIPKAMSFNLSRSDLVDTLKGFLFLLEEGEKK